MKENENTQELDIRRIIFRIFREWRTIILFSLVVAVIISVIFLIFNINKITNKEYINEQRKNYEYNLASHKAIGKSLEQDIYNLTMSQIKQEDYNNNSVLMKINPFSENISSITYYVDTDYQIIPDMMYQNIDLSKRVISAYWRYISNGEMYQYIIENLSYVIDMRYLQEIIEASYDYDTNMIYIEVHHVDKESCQEIINLITQGINNKHSEVTESIGEHSLTTTNASSYENVNLELDEQQKANIQYISDITTLIQEKNEEYSQWKNTSEPQADYVIVYVIKKTIKTFILGVIISFFIAIIYIIIYFITSDKIQETYELKRRYGINVIGELPCVHKKRLCVKIDRMIAKLCSIPIKAIDYNNILQVIELNIRAYLLSNKSINGTPVNENAIMKIAFTGTTSEAEINCIISKFHFDTTYMLINAANFLTTATAVEKIIEADYVILVEKQEFSTCSRIEKELDMIETLNKKLLGAIVVDVDSIP